MAPATTQPVSVLELPTPRGPARAHLHRARDARGALVLGHGAGGGIGAPDLVAVTRAAVAEGLTVVLVEQPYRVAGRRSPAPARALDADFIAVTGQLAGGELAGLRLITGGRSSGARVACRTAEATGAAGVLCLAFPLIPPGGKGPEARPTRLPELEAVAVPVLIIQGASDRFGMPPASETRSVVKVAGDHSLRKDTGAVAEAASVWLTVLLAGQ
jgi:predicted alpha/beta-hydrolase family hydrolase